MRRFSRAVLMLGATCLAFALIAPPPGADLRPAAQAQTAAPLLDLAEARRQGSVLREALALGAGGNWAAAEAEIAREGDPLLADIVLWRKLRAGAGSIGEYRAYAARRPNWPGHTQLREVVLGERSGGGDAAALSGTALTNWREFSRIYRSDRDRAAERLDALSMDAAALGVPQRWATRRRSLARAAARDGRPTLAYRLAARHHLTPAAGYAYADCEWIAGWVALRRLNDPQLALAHFERFEAAVETPISLGRGGYWVGRALAALGRNEAARAAYGRAARFPTSFYGQLAAAEIGAAGDPALARPDLPDWRTQPAVQTDDVRMATVLTYAGERGLSDASFNRIGRLMRTQDDLAALADLTLEIGKPHVAVRLAKTGARRGWLIYPAYYPLHPLGIYVDDVEPAFALSVARQETELNPEAVSRAGARGLMQLMPGTAKLVAGQLGEPYDKRRLLTDWRYNARLGSRYLRDRVRAFGGSYVLAAAAYNAGPRRAADWSKLYGDPRDPSVDVIDWIETIPFNETRNYVQRVMEGLYVYRSRLTGRAGPMTILEDLARGRRG
ncbi:MAG: lytic transglycosylase domain-containing protein [Pikeienuella sp.]